MQHNDYYVYVHRRKDNGEVFYVGHGRMQRAKGKSCSKTKDWVKIEKEAGGHYIEYLHTGLTKETAEDLEKDYIIKPPEGWELVNKRLPIKRLCLDYEELSNLWGYDENSPSGLIWVGSKFKSFNGMPAGGIQNTNKHGRNKQYWVVRKNNKLYLAHRVIYVLLTKTSIPKDKVVDHIDGDGTNNNKNNLRLVSQVENCISSVKSASNSGYKHIFREGNFLVLNICNELHGKIIRKRSISKYGYEEALRQLIEIRDSFLKQ